MPPGMQDLEWPRLLSLEASQPLKFAAALLTVCLVAVAVLDLVQVTDEPLAVWVLMFGNGGPVEWVQWALLGLTAIAAAFLSSRTRSRFFLLFSFAAVLLLIEDAGDPRHRLAAYATALFGEEIAGLPTSMLVEMPYFAALAAVPVYALVRYRSEVWRYTSARRFVVGGYGLYAVAALGSGLRELGSYEALGQLIDRSLGGRLPMGPYEAGQGHLQFVDGVFEESLELIAAACLLGLVLASASEDRVACDVPRDVEGEQESTHPTAPPG